MKVDEALAGVRLLGIDTTPLIYFVEQNTAYVDRMRAILQRVDAGAPPAVTSVITLTEVLVMPIETDHQHYVSEYRAMLLNTDHILAVPVSVDVAERAAWLRVKYQLRTPDALHVATALESGCDAFLTNDAGFRHVSELRVLVLDELE